MLRGSGADSHMTRRSTGRVKQEGYEKATSNIKTAAGAQELVWLRMPIINIRWAPALGVTGTAYEGISSPVLVRVLSEPVLRYWASPWSGRDSKRPCRRSTISLKVGLAFMSCAQHSVMSCVNAGCRSSGRSGRLPVSSARTTWSGVFPSKGIFPVTISQSTIPKENTSAFLVYGADSANTSGASLYMSASAVTRLE